MAISVQQLELVVVALLCFRQVQVGREIIHYQTLEEESTSESFRARARARYHRSFASRRD